MYISNSGLPLPLFFSLLGFSVWRAHQTFSRTMSNRTLSPFVPKAAFNESDNDDNIPLSSLVNHHIVKQRKRPRASSSQDETHTSKTNPCQRIHAHHGNETRQSAKKKQRNKEYSQKIPPSKEKENERSEVTTNLSEESTQRPEEEQPSVDNGRLLGSSSCSIVHQLYQREITSHWSTRYPPPAAHATWSLLYSSIVSFGQTKIAAMAWDHEGILLAIATANRTVLVFDWDVMRVASRASMGAMEQPLCTISVPYPITTMQWDTGDCLAMSFRGTSHVRVYDVARVVGHHGNIVECCCGCCCTCLDTTLTTKSAVALQCLPRRQWLVAYGDGHVILWKYRKKGNVMPVWKWREHSMVFTGIHPFGDTTTVLLTNDKVWLALDWNHCMRMPFSSEKTPTICNSWNALGSVRALSLNQHHLHCTWVSAEGWVRSVDLASGNVEKRILHRPPPLLIQTRAAADGSNETKKSSQYSQPLQAVVACATSSLVVWETVPQVTHILPHHDRRNVGGTLQVVRSPQRSLSIIDSYDRIVEIPMQLYSIEQVTLHPSNEWLVVAGDGTLQVWIARKLPTTTTVR